MSERQLIRDQVSVPDALEMLELEPPNHQGKIHCPFHEELTPSCHIFDDHFHCFGCGLNGDVVFFVAKMAGIPLWKAIQFLLSGVDELATSVKVEQKVRAPIDLTRQMVELSTLPSQSEDSARAMLARKWRTLDWDYCRQLGWRQAKDGGILIPHYDPTGEKVVGIKHRTATGEKTSVKGSTFSSGPYLGWSAWPYPHESQIPPDHDVILCEGEPDTAAMRLHVGGLTQGPWPRAYGLPSGAGAYPDSVHDFLKGFKRVYLALDNDSAGQAATADVMKALLGHSDVEDVLSISTQYAPHKDVADALAAGWVPRF